MSLAELCSNINQQEKCRPTIHCISVPTFKVGDLLLLTSVTFKTLESKMGR